MASSPFVWLPARAQSAYAFIREWTDRHRVLVMAAMAVWLLAVLVGAAGGKTFWHDEVYTVLLADLPVGSIWRAHVAGVDLSPPLNTFLTHVAQSIAGAGPVISRLPSILGFLAGDVLLFLAVQRRTNTVMGLLAALLPTATPAWNYAMEARSYGLTFGCFAWALYAWSSATRPNAGGIPWGLMAVAIGAGLWTHYYAILFLVPIVAGEVVRQVRSGRVDWRPWLAIAGSGLLALPLWPLAAAAAANQPTFWARPGQQTMADVYKYMLKDLPSHPFVIGALVLLVIIEIRGGLRRGHGRRSHTLLPHEVAACLACLAVPACGLILGRETQVFTTRYLVFATAGLAFALPQLLWSVVPEDGLWETAAVGVLLWSFVGVTHTTVNDVRDRLQHPQDGAVLEDRRLLRDFLRGGDPIALPWGVDYLGFWYALSSELRSHAIYLADPEGELALEGSDSVDRGYLALAQWTPVPVVPMTDYLRSHPRFLVYARSENWSNLRLASLGAAIVEQAREPGGSGVMYQVSLPGSELGRTP